jgi:3-phenylpropionate/cinnamic acid dioxygenase small subunit
MTPSKLRDRLLEEVVIFDRSDATETGARAIAPDHSPRQAHRPRELPARGRVETNEPGGGLLRRIEQFLFYQSELLDGKHWSAFIDLFAADGVYWMPVTPEQTEWLDSPSIFAEDKAMMEVRMGRVTHPNAWSQAPHWATSHVIYNVVIESESESEVLVRSRFHMIELRRDQARHFGGTYRHTLLRNGDDFAIRLQRVDMVNSQAPYDYVLQIWV